MISGEFKSIPTSMIYVDREDRQRRVIDSEQLTELANSILKIGLIHPLVIQRDGKLVAGERRYRACLQLGWDNIPVQYVDELNEDKLQLIELDENIRRVDLTWQERVAAVERYDNLQRKLNPEWTETDTASSLGLSQSEVKENIRVAKAVENKDPLVSRADNYSTARNVIRRAVEREKASALNAIVPSVQVKEVPFINGDFIEWQKSYTGPLFNFLHCDFPYGINAGEHKGNAGKELGVYEDSFETYSNLLDALAAGMTNVVSPSAHMIFWFSMNHFEYTKTRLKEMGWVVNPFPLIWTKTDGVLPDPKRGPRRTYETAFLCSRGDRLIVEAVKASYEFSARTKEFHMSEKPMEMLSHFFRMTVDHTTIGLDPTCGSANALKVMKSRGAQHIFGLELSTDFFEKAKEAFI